ncbi:MAG: TRZ/ATZ family hydrolase [Gammaproteobacteria bacterium]|nr:TRZ/ATZ family hydrolase [Gammaproteobacteria bacterium]
MNIDTLLLARWVIPIEPAHTVYENYAIAIHNGRILALLPQSQLDNYHAQTQVSLQHHVLMPGLINAHTHAAMNPLRGYADDLPLMTWLQEHIWPAERKLVSPNFVYDGSLHACAEMIRGGITCFNDMYFFPEQTARAVELAGMRAVIGLIMIDFPSAYAQNAKEYLHKGLQLHDQLRSRQLLTTAFAPHAPYTVSDAPLQEIATYAEELDIPIHMHVHETAAEVEQAVAQQGIRPLQRLHQLGLLSPRLLAVHMTQLLDDEIALLVRQGVQVLHCPESNLKLASGFCPLHKLMRAGVNVGLGTDGAASNNDLDMFGEMRSAALLAKAVAHDARAADAESVLRMATINSARALGLEDHIGSLEANKAADIIAIKLDSVETLPVFNPVSQLVYATGRQHVTDLWVAGKQLMKDRQLITLDSHEILSKVNEWQHILVTT